MASSSRQKRSRVPTSLVDEALFVNEAARKLYVDKVSRRPIAVERKVVLQDLHPYDLVGILHSSGIIHFLSYDNQAYEYATHQFYANIHNISLDPPSFDTCVFKTPLTITPDFLVEKFSFPRPDEAIRSTTPLTLDIEQSDALENEGLLFLCSKRFQFLEAISTVGLGDRWRVLHRIMVSSLFCRTGTLAEVDRVEAYQLWRAGLGETLDCPLIVWCQMINTYDGPANFSLPFGGMIRALLPDGLVPAGSPLIPGLEAISKKTFRAMKIPEGPAQPSFEHRVLEHLGRLEDVMVAQTQVVQDLHATVDRQGRSLYDLTQEVRDLRIQRG